MKLPQKVSQWLKTIPTFKFLFLLAIFLLSYALLSQQYIKFKQSSQIDHQTIQIIDFIVTSSDQQILPLLKSNKLELISESLERQLNYEAVFSIAIYKSDGSLIDKVSKPENSTENLLSKVSNLQQDNENLGYLVYQFRKKSHSNFGSPFWLYYLAGGLWLLACIIFMLKKPTKNTEPKETLNIPRLSYKKELQQLLKRSQSQSQPKNLLIIHTSWEAYNNKPRQPLLSLLNKWTAHHKSHLVSFDKDLLILGLPSKVNLELLKKIQILEICLKQLGVDPTILVHSLSFGESIYQHFFGIVEQGIWLESNSKLNDNSKEFSIKKDIEIEVESFGDIHLQLIDALTSEDATFIERQSRFFLQ